MTIRHSKWIINGLGWLALALLLGAGLPLFLCMPLETDVTNYDICARNVLSGGTHYRDVFDNNLPGIVWIHSALRALLGWRSEVLRAADFVFVAAIVGLLVRWLRRAGRPAGVQVWAAVALFAFYLSTTEWNHCQRDTWMLLPALTAFSLRCRQAERLAETVQPLVGLAAAAVEGLLWGAALWIKPFVFVPLLTSWLMSARLAWRGGGNPVRRLTVDAAGLLAGGLAAGGLGVAWLMATGAWPYFLEVFQDWNRDYYHARDWQWHLLFFFGGRFFPLSLVNLAAVPLASAWVGAHWLGAAPPRPQEALRALLASFYLGWAVQALGLQHGWDYVQVPTILLALTLLAGWELRPGQGWVAASVGAVFLGVAAWLHPLARPQRLALWGRCWQEGSAPEMKDRLALTPNVDWQDLGRVADYLRRQGLEDGTLTCFDGRTIPLYLELDLKPSTRYAYFGTILTLFPKHRPVLREALAGSRQRFLVTDLGEVGLKRDQAREIGPGGPLALPPSFARRETELRKELRNRYPWTEPICFRAGRYLVHRASSHVGPTWLETASPSVPAGAAGK